MAPGRVGAGGAPHADPLFWPASLQLELKKTLLDRMVHLLSRGYVLPVVSYIRKCLEKLDTDISLIRYFVTEVSSAPPLVSCFMFFTLAVPFMA